MNGKINVSIEDYGVGFKVYNWNLEVSHKNGQKQIFLLGQDVKFCSRVLGMEMEYLLKLIGVNNLCNEESLEKLGNFIIEELELTEENVVGLQGWELCCQ